MPEQKKVGILTLYYNNYNFGALLQAYALQTVIYGLGYECEQIAYDWRSDIYKKYLTNIDLAEFSEFIDFEKSIKHSDILYTKENIACANEQYDCFVCGSDQIWNDQLGSYDTVSLQDYFLIFASKHKTKIFYGASMGKSSLLPRTQRLLTDGLKRADAISVRERSAQDYLDTLCPEIKSELVLDPTLLVDAELWRSIAQKPNRPRPYVLLYLLGNNRHTYDIRTYAKTIAKKNGFDLISLPCANVGPKQFLGLIDDAELILTNSFHGAVFSVLFHKRFRVFGVKNNQDPIKTNSRMYDFCTMLGLEAYIGKLEAVNDMYPEQPDYQKVDSILRDKRESSFRFLKMPSL